MATDAFNRSGSDFGGAIAADGAKIVFSSGGGGLGAGGVGLLSQQVQVSYSQQITRLYEIGSNYTFYVAGRTQGQLSLSRVLGPRKVQTQFYRSYGDVCNAANNNIGMILAAGCNVPGALGQISFIIRNVVITSLGLSTSAQDMIINEQLQAMAVALEIQD